MIVMTADHPDREQLQAYGQGRLAPEAARALEEHLAACEGCCDLLDQAPGDSFASRLRDAGSDSRPGQGTSTDLGGATVTDAPAIPAELIAHPRYRVLGLVGQGGMGAVYRAEHLHMQRLVALKVINPGLMRHPAAVQRFQQEVRAAARLTHPNIVHAYDADQAGGLHFLVMEHVEGTSLADRVRECGPLPVAEACDCARQAALGLQHAHEQGMVHRDVKPHNLMLTPGGQVKILDFGLARLPRTPDGPAGEGLPAAPLTGAGAVMGTADYIAPEQAADPRAADIRADVYSLGCTLFHLLTGQPPFPDGTVAEKLACHTATPLPAVSEWRPEVPSALAAVLARMTAKDPADRHATPAEVAEALTLFCPVDVLPLPRVRTRWRRLAVLLVVLAAGLAGLGAVFLRLGRDRGETGGQPEDRDPGQTVREEVGPKPGETEEAAVKVILNLGGQVTRDETALDKPVVSVNLAGTKATDADLRAVAAFKRLKTLDIGNTRVTDAGLKHLTGLADLRTLTLHYLKITDGAMKHVGQLKDLERLDLLFTPIGDAGIKHLRGLTRLSMLSLWGPRVTDAGMPDLAQLTNLVQLNLHGTALTDVGVKSLGDLTRMFNLNLTMNRDVGDEAMKTIARMKHLRYLDLHGTRLTDQGLKSLAGLIRLQGLQIGRTRVTDAGLPALKDMKDLKNLSMGWTLVTDKGLKEVAGHRSLMNLDLQETRNVTDEGLKELAGMPQLRFLNLCWTDVSDAGLKELVGLPALRDLWLGGTDVTDAGIQELARCPQLRLLYLGGAKRVTAAGAAELCKARPSIHIHR